MEPLSEHSDTTKKRFTFTKEERLCSKKTIDKLFADGESFLAYPFKVVFLRNPISLKSPVQAGFSVGKRNFKRAVQRNRIKRLMRESYRLNKPELYKKINSNRLAVFFIFIGKSIPKYPEVEKGMKNAIKKLVKEMSVEINPRP